MLVKNPNPHILAIPLHNPNDELKLDNPAIANAGGSIPLNQGWNEIEPNDYVLCRSIIERLESKGLVECKRMRFKDAEEDVEVPIYKVRTDQAKKIVEDCWNPKNLERWANDIESTSEIRSCAELQLKKISEYKAPPRI